MISLERTRELLDNPTLSDKEVEEYRDVLTQFAELTLDIVTHKKKRKED